MFLWNFNSVKMDMNFVLYVLQYYNESDLRERGDIKQKHR